MIFFGECVAKKYGNVLLPCAKLFSYEIVWLKMNLRKSDFEKFKIKQGLNHFMFVQKENKREKNNRKNREIFMSGNHASINRKANGTRFHSHKG